MNPGQWQSIAAAFARRAGDADSRSLCAVCTEIIGVAGAGITLMGGDETGPLCVMGHGAAALEAMQFTLGEGPCHDAFRSGEPVRVVRLDADAPSAWLPFAELAVRTGVGAVFAYPLLCDGARLGVLTLYERRAGDLTEDQHALCLGVADVLAATLASTDHVDAEGSLTGMINEAFTLRAEIHQSSGMIAVQLAIPASEALLRIRAHAFASSRPVADVAADIVARRLRLDNDRMDPLSEAVEP